MARGGRFFDVSILTVPTVQISTSDYKFIVPAGQVYMIYSVAINYVASETAGNRLVTVSLIDGKSGWTVAQYVAGAVAVAESTKVYSFAPGHPNDTSFSSNGVMQRSMMTNPVLTSSSFIQIRDNNVVDGTGDAMSVNILVEVMNS